MISVIKFLTFFTTMVRKSPPDEIKIAGRSKVAVASKWHWEARIIAMTITQVTIAAAV